MKNLFLFILLLIFNNNFAQNKKVRTQYGLTYEFRYGLRNFNPHLKVSFMDFNKDSIFVKIEKDSLHISQKKIARNVYEKLIKDFQNLKPKKMYKKTLPFLDCHSTELSLNIDLCWNYSYSFYCLSNRLDKQKEVIKLVKKIYEIIGEDYNCYYNNQKCINTSQ